MLLTRIESRSERLVSGLLLALILVVATLLRFNDLDRTSLWYDEAVSWSQSKVTLSALLTSVAADNYPPLHNVILWLTMPVLGDSETALRLPSAVLGVLAVWLLYLVGRMIGGRPAGLLAAALLAVSPFHIWYSTEARMYALLAACGLAYLLATLKILERPNHWWFVALALSGALFLYSHIYALFVFASVGTLCAVFTLSDIMRTGNIRQSNAFLACVAMGVSTLTFLPWLFILANRARSVAEAGFWIAHPDLTFLKNMAFSISGSLTFFWLLIGLSAVCLLLSLFRPLAKGQEIFGHRRAVLVCVAFAVGPVALAYLYSVLVQPILFDRYLIAAWPGLLLLATVGALRLSTRIGPITLLGAALIFTYPELIFTLTQKVRPEWREIAEEYKRQKSPDDLLVLYKGFAAPALAYYLREPDGFLAIDSIDEYSSDVANIERENLWFLLVHSNAEETNRAREAFGVSDSEPFARTFGWGESGLSLFQTPSSARSSEPED